MSHIDPSCPEMRGSRRRISKDTLCMVCVRAWGWCDVPCRPQGVVLGASQDPKTSHILGGKTVMWGTILCQNGTPHRHNCTGCIKWVICNFLMGGSTILTNRSDCWADCVLKTEICVCRQMCTHRARKTCQRPTPTTLPPQHIFFRCPYLPGWRKTVRN